MNDLSEEALEKALSDIENLQNLSFRPARMCLNQASIDLMTKDELVLVQEQGLEALSKERREFLVNALMKNFIASKRN